jgi:hypothetical protein
MEEKFKHHYRDEEINMEGINITGRIFWWYVLAQ